MRNVSGLKNYTYSMYDEIFDMTTEISFTENAYYVSYDNPSTESAVPFGYAEDLEGRVFEYRIENDSIVPGDYYRNTDGSIRTDLWANAIISFADFNIEALPDQPTSDNRYVITDESNRLLFAALAGYGDVYVMPYVTVEVEVTGENSFVSTVTFTPEGNDKYTGRCTGTLTKIGETVIPYIDSYLQGGGSAAESHADTLLLLLQTLKSENNYTLEVVSSTHHYRDTVTSDYYYSDNVDNPASSKGYLNLPDHAYNFTMSADGEVVLGNEITYTSSSSKSFWDNVSSVHNFRDINLSDLPLEETSEGLKSSGNLSFLNSLYSLVHSTSFFPSVDIDTDYVLFTDIEEERLSFTLHIESEADFEVTITDIGLTKNDAVSEFIETMKDHDSTDLSGLVDSIRKIQQANSYQISLVNNFSAFAPSLSGVGSLRLTVTADDYFVENQTDSSKSYGYRMNEGVLTRYTMEGGEIVFGETFDGNMEDNDVFVTMNDIDADHLVAEWTLQGDYRISDDDTLSLFASLLTFPTTDFLTNVSQISLTVLPEGGLRIEESTSFYGSFEAEVSIL